MAITLDDVVLEQMQTNEQLQIMHKTDLAAFAIERQGFRDLIEKQEDLISVITAETLRQSRSDRERNREESDTGGDGGDGGGNKPDDFRAAVGGAAAGGIGKGIGSVASLAGLAAGIVAFVGTLAAGGALVKMMGIDFNGLKHMLVGVADAFAAADTFGLIKMAGFLALGGLAKLDAVNAGLFGASMAAFMLGLGAGGKILDVLGFDFSGLKNVLVSFADAFKAASTEGLIKMAGFLAVGAYVKGNPADALKFGASIAAFMLGLGAGGAIMDFFGMDFTGLKNVLVGLGEAFAQMPAEGYIMLGIMAAATAMVGPSTMAKAGLGIAAFIAPLGIVGAILDKMGGGDGFGSLMKNIGEGLAAFGNVRTLAAMLVFGAVAAIPGGFAILGLAGAGIALFLLAIGGASVVLKTLGADGSGIKTLMENISAGIDSFSQINFKNLLLMGPAMVSVAAGLAAFMAGSLVAGIGNFVKKLFGGGRDKSSIEIIAEDLAHLNEIDFKNLAGMGPVAIAIDKMADAIEKLNEVMDDIDDDLFEKLKEMLSGASFTVASEAPVRTFTGQESYPIPEPPTRLAVKSGPQAGTFDDGMETTTEYKSSRGNVSGLSQSQLDAMAAHGMKPTKNTTYEHRSESRKTLTDAQRKRVEEIEAMSHAEYRQLSSYDKTEFRIMRAQKQKEDRQNEPLDSFEKGTDFVPKTGNYTLHQGEAVIPANENFENLASVQRVWEEIGKIKKEYYKDHEAVKKARKSELRVRAKALAEMTGSNKIDPRIQWEADRIDRGFWDMGQFQFGSVEEWTTADEIGEGNQIPGMPEGWVIKNMFPSKGNIGISDEFVKKEQAFNEVMLQNLPKASQVRIDSGIDNLTDYDKKAMDIYREKRLRIRSYGDQGDAGLAGRAMFGGGVTNTFEGVDMQNEFGDVRPELMNEYNSAISANRKASSATMDFLMGSSPAPSSVGMLGSSVSAPPVDTAATDFVQRDAMANVANSQAAPNVVIQDNSVNSSSQTSTTVSNKPPMPSPLNDNRTRANAYAMG